MKVIAFLVVLFYSTSSSANFFSYDTIPKPHQLTKQQFLNKYGNDDTSRAAIHYFFRRNRIAKQGLIISLGLGVASALVLNSFINSPPRGGIFAGLGGGILAGIVFYVSVILIIFNIFYWIRFSRQSLIKQLENYKSGKPLPKRILRDKVFQKYLEEQLAEK